MGAARNPAGITVHGVLGSVAPGLDLAEGAIVAGKYRIERLLSAGGMGAVWVATHLMLDTAVAIKFMGIPYDARHISSAEAILRARFEREARIAAQLRSVNIVQILDYGVDGSRAYIVMEMLQGEDLEQRLQRRGRLPLDETAALMVPVLQLLQRAHDASMVHRDLKPANIFIAIDGDKEVPKVLDFGVAKDVGGAATGVDLTSEQAIVGSPSYASPEQLTKSVAIDHRADIWSMGVVLFEMLTGSRPFSKEQVVPAIVEVCTAPIPTPTHVLPDLPPEVDRFFERALARDLARRFGSAREMAQALADLAGIVPASQRRVPAEVDPADERTVPETPADRSGDRAPSEGAPSMAHVASALARPRGPRRYGRALIPVAMIAALAVAIFALRILRAPSNVPSGMAVAITPVATLRDTSPLTPSDSSTELAQPTSGRSVAESASAVSSAPRGVAPANAGRARRSQSSHPAAALPVVPTSRSKPEQDVEVGY